MIIGDFNVDLRSASKHSQLLECFIKDNSLKVDDYLNEQSLDHTFNGTIWKSWIDHCITELANRSVNMCRIFCHAENDSDHHPLLINYNIDETIGPQKIFKERKLKKLPKIDYLNEDFVKECLPRLTKVL